MNTPWGFAQTVHAEGARGVLSVSTASHGGIFVPDALLAEIPAIERAYAAQWSGSENWFEEDCAAAIPLFRLRVDFARYPLERAKAYFDSVSKYWTGDNAQVTP